jgi:hypothetical protein
MLIEEHKRKCMGAVLTFLVHFHQEGDHFFDQIVTGDETWVSHIICESTHQSLEWHLSHSQSEPIKFKQVSTRKVLTTVFLGLERRPPGEIYAQEQNHQYCVLLCNSKVATTCHPEPPATQSVSRSGFAAQ